MSALAMSRPLSKTYSRNSQKVDSAAKAFDAVVLGTSGMPSPVKATSTIQKWGKASFTSIRGSVVAESQKSRKRKIEDEKTVASDDDPFSFDLEDVGPSKVKRGMGYKVPEKMEKAKGAVNSRKTLGDNGRKNNMNIKFQKCDNGDDEMENTNSGSSSIDIPVPKADKSDDFEFAVSIKTCEDRGVDGRGAKSEKSFQKPSAKKQLLIDRFMNDSNQVKTELKMTMNLGNSKQLSKVNSKLAVGETLKPPTARKFFVSRDRGTETKKKDSNGDLTTRSHLTAESDLPNDERYGQHKNDRLWVGDSDNLDNESSDPEIIFNLTKKTTNQDTTVVDKPSWTDEQSLLALDAKPNALGLTKRATEMVRKRDRKTPSEAVCDAGAEKLKYKEAPVPKRLLTHSKKSTLKKKASYNHRQWQNSDDEEGAVGSSSGQSLAVEPKKSSRETMAFESDDEEPIKSPAVLYRAVGQPSLQPAADPVTGIKVSKKHKPLFMVVRNVKRAHECQEYGETQEFTDDIDYIMDGLNDSQRVSTRCLSAINLVNKCASHAFRMHLRAHGILAKIMSALNDAAKYPTLALCTAAIMYMMSRDRLTLELDESSLELILQVLSSEALPADEDSQLVKDHEAIQQKIHSVFDGFHQNGRVQHTNMLISDITAGHLAMEALLRLTSRRDGDWFKDELRTLGGLDRIVDTVCEAIESIDEVMLELTDAAIDVLTKVDRCFRVLENVTYLKPENQNHLINYNSSALIRSLSSCLRLCESCLPFNELTTKGDKVNKESPGYIVYSCLLATVRVLVNLTHDNEVGSAKVGQQDGLIKTMLACVLRLPRYLPAAERFDVLVLGLGLLVNLIEHSRNNLRVLLNTPTVAPFDQYPSISGSLNALEALGMLFSLRFEAAKMIEEEHDAELEEKERQRQETASKCMLGSQLDGNESGIWQESDSGIQWIAVTKESKMAESVSGGSDDASSVGDFQLPSGTSSQGESENFTKALHKAGRHMEDSIVAAYVALVVGCVIQHNVDLAEKVRDTLPDCSFDPMIRMLRKFLGFMNLTSASAANSSKSILRVLEVLESC